MCAVLKCCQQTADEPMMFNLETEFDLSVLSALHSKPLVRVDGQPARFARVESLRPAALDKPEDEGSATAAGMVQTHGGPLEVVDTSRPAEASLPSATAVWSPILTIRTFVEPLASRASTFWNTGRFSISFHDPEQDGVVVDNANLTHTLQGGLRDVDRATSEVEELENGEEIVVAAPAVVGGDGEGRDSGGFGAVIAGAAAAQGRLVANYPQLGGSAVEMQQFAMSDDEASRYRGSSSDEGKGIVAAGMEREEKEEIEEEEEEEEEKVITVDFGRPEGVVGGAEISAV